MSDKEKNLSNNLENALHYNVHENTAKRWGYRHQQCFILFCVLAVAYSMRACMGVSLVAMVTYDGANKITQNLTAELKQEELYNGLMLVPPYPIFHWNKKIQDTVIASFFWGYMLLQIPAGQLVHKFGVRYLLTGAMTINCIASILLPTATLYGGWYCTVVCRVVQGLSQACVIPSLHTALGKWTPLHERGRLSAFAHGGQALGTVFALPMTGFISASPLGWPGIFRIFGLVAGIMALLIWFLVADSPCKHPKISEAEKRYIEDDIGANEDKKKMPVPWMKILRHKGVYAVIIAHIGQSWGQLILYSEVPAYMDKMMGVNIKAMIMLNDNVKRWKIISFNIVTLFRYFRGIMELLGIDHPKFHNSSEVSKHAKNGLLTALPFLVMWFSNFFFSWLTDWLIVNNKMSVTNTRKFANSLGSVPAGIGLIALAYAPHNIYYVETLLVLICSFKIASHCGFMLSEIDMSPNYAGTIMSISNFTSNIGSSIGPIITGFILTDVGDKYLWRQVFFLSAGLYLMTNLIYVIIGTSEYADFNDPPKHNADEENVPMMGKTKTTIEK